MSIRHVHSRISEPGHAVSVLRYGCWYGLGGLGEKPHGRLARLDIGPTLVIKGSPRRLSQKAPAAT
jgi:hypothetical protein